MEARRSRLRAVELPCLRPYLPEEKLPARRLEVEIVTQHRLLRPGTGGVAEAGARVALPSAAQKSPAIVPHGPGLLDVLGRREAISASRQAAEKLVELVAAEAIPAAKAAAAADGEGGS